MDERRHGAGKSPGVGEGKGRGLFGFLYAGRPARREGGSPASAGPTRFRDRGEGRARWAGRREPPSCPAPRPGHPRSTVAGGRLCRGSVRLELRRASGSSALGRGVTGQSGGSSSASTCQSCKKNPPEHFYFGGENLVIAFQLFCICLGFFVVGFVLFCFLNTYVKAVLPFTFHPLSCC